MSGSAPITLSYYTNRGTILYTPSALNIDRNAPASLPTPPCRPRARRPHSIHITRLPAGFVPFDLRPAPPPKEPRKPSKYRVELRKLASRENAKRVFGSVFSRSSSASPSTRSAASSTSTAESSAAASERSLSPETTRSFRTSFSAASADPNTIAYRRSIAGPVVADPARVTPPIMSSRRPSLAAENGPSPRNSIAGRPPLNAAGSVKTVAESDRVCAATGIACSIILAEPVIYLTGLDHDGTTRDSGSATSALLRGKLQLNITKSTKIKKVAVKFTGKAKTLWPEGIPPEKTQTSEEESFRNETIPFFNAIYEGSESGYGTSCNYALRDKSASSSMVNLTDPPSPAQQNSGFSLGNLTNRGSRSSTLMSGLTAKEMKRLSLQSNQSRSFQKDESPFGPTPQQKGYKTFHPGVYEYSFELTLDNNMPETTNLPLASVKWELEAIVERAGTFKANLTGKKEVSVIRSPSEDSLELVEPISINRQWEDQLHYDIMISGKSFPLGSRIPIAFKLTPLAKVHVHKLKVYISETVEYYAKNKKVQRRDTARKILLLEKSAGKPLDAQYAPSEVNVIGGELTAVQREQRRHIAMERRERYARHNGGEAAPLPEPVENLLGDIDLGVEEWLGPTEIEMAVQLPTCAMIEKDRLRRMHHDCTWKNVDVHHWIKIVMRISRLDADDPTGKKRRHFEISIDSPISILNCRATQINLALPEYSDRDATSLGRRHVCGCPNAAELENSPTSSTDSVPTVASLQPDSFETAAPDLARPPQAHLSTNAASGVQRPIHMLRAPSYNPPPFDFDQPPPPAATPPPMYDAVIGTPSHDGLADYFARLSEYDNEQSDDEDSNRAASRGRVNVANPRTPGGRIARSMDIPRNFMNNVQDFDFNPSVRPGMGENTVRLVQPN